MRRIVLVLAVLASVAPAGPPASADGPCSPGARPGGEWRSYGRDLRNSRHQAEETAISAANAGSLQKAWATGAASMGGSGVFSSTPAVADGCVFVASDGNAGGGSQVSVYAMDAFTGAPVWRTPIPGGPSFLGGAFAPSVADGRVHVIVGQTIPSAVALDEQTGEILWRKDFPDLIHSIGIQASAVVFDGLLFVATVGWDLLLPFSRPFFYILDAETGEELKRTQVITDAEYLDGFQAGGGSWSTPAVDAATKHLYVGTTNPYNKVKEHAHTNSIMKVDLDRGRPTFGEIVGNYKGDVDYDPALYNTFQCQVLGELQAVYYSIFCGQKDVDFGASPNIFTDSSGRVLVGDLQKSGVYHAVDTTTMANVWRANDLAAPAAGGNSATSSVDEQSIYTATDANRLYALNKDTGATRWVATHSGIGGYLPTSVANGVIYTMGSAGNLYAIDASNGAELLNVQLSDISGPCEGVAAAGVAVAYNTVYATCSSGAGGASVGGLVGVGGGVIVAYRL